MFEESAGAKQLLKEMHLRQQEIENNLKKEVKVGKKANIEEEEVINKKIREIEVMIDNAQSMEEVQELEKQIKELEDQRDV